MITSSARRQPAEVRRGQILDAAEAMMLRNGMHDTTMAEIAESARLGKGTIYLQFESKQDLAAGLRHRYVQRIEEEVKTAVATGGNSVQQLNAFVRSFVSASTRQPALHHLLFQEAGVDEADAFASLRAMFADVIKTGDYNTSNLDLAIDYAFGGLHAAMITLAHAAPNRRSRSISQITELVVHTLSR